MFERVKVCFRVDASPTIGIGHFMRCLALADFLKKEFDISFISRDIPSYLIELLFVRSYAFTKLARPVSGIPKGRLIHSDWLGVCQHEDAAETLSVIGNDCALMIVDHYGIDSEWESLIRRNVKSIFVIDDLADRHHDCDILLDQNLYLNYHTRYTNLVPDNCVLLLGPGFAILRKEFSQLRQKIMVRDGHVKRILVLLGGMDMHNITEKVVRAIADLNDNKITADVIVGKEHPALQQIELLCKEHNYNFIIQSENVGDLMAQTDLAFGSSGSTSWERCCMGLPTLCLTQAFNQFEIAEGLAASGTIINLGDGVTISTEEITNALKDLISKPVSLIMMSKSCLEVVDGKGTEKIFRLLKNLQLHAHHNFND
jgi:UDP-2,4-diacetamido-2,4,6-trideoxy-beta-L-altropyranose hydrolase